MQPKEWITEFLYYHNISHPDKRPLYQYRITDEEFEALSARLGLSLISKQLPRGNVFSVLYESSAPLPMSFYGVGCGRAVPGKDWSVTTLSAAPAAGRVRVQPPQ